ncbi:hypothetical protein QUF80_23595 [Desulfococcaceae bacterium HSG8]|nr:hypothetical protein [Desulfococcaceae bacterium HSG8]
MHGNQKFVSALPSSSKYVGHSRLIVLASLLESIRRIKINGLYIDPVFDGKQIVPEFR